MLWPYDVDRRRRYYGAAWETGLALTDYGGARLLDFRKCGGLVLGEGRSLGCFALSTNDISVGVSIH